MAAATSMATHLRIPACVFATSLLWHCAAMASEPKNGPVDFARDIAPILEQHCIRCHQPAIKKGDLSLATRADLDANEYLSAGNPDESHLLEVVTPVGGAKPEMPKEGTLLTTSEIALLRQWIEQGAPWPGDIVIKEKSKADRSWWSLRPLNAGEPPIHGAPPSWSVNPIDRFVSAKLNANGLRPNPPADRRTLIRRVTFDLTGLPPTPAEVSAFVADDSPRAYENLVDRLLESPRYGEQFGRQWLDVVRFGESTGFEVNHLIDTAWPYRDYVIRSFNEDKPFDRFVLEQLAGDSLDPGNPNVEVGLTFLVCGPFDIVGNADPVQAAQIRADTVDEMIRATSESFLGLTVGCARCHDHKFDPITQRDYYSLYATLSGVHHDDRVVAPEEAQRQRAEKLAPLEAKKKELQETKTSLEKTSQDAKALSDINAQLADVDREIAAVPKLTTLRVGHFEQPAADQSIFERGDAQRKGEHVVPASMSTLADAAKPYELADSAREKDRRLALARWLIAADNPLTPRVVVNRLWQDHFGTGIVATPNDFGYMGEQPSHPELLDWLARQLIEGGWKLKSLQKLIVMSQAYQQSSDYRAEAASVDGGSRLLWRFPPQRLSAEEIRDTMLFTAGELDERMGGPGFRLYEYTRDNVATYTPLESFGPETYRRSVYHQNARSSRIDLLSDFDAPDCAFSASRRVPTTTPSQALALLNHSFTITMAQALAERATAASPGTDTAAQITHIFELTFGRAPIPSEIAAATRLIEQYGLRAFSRAVLNSNEMIYLN